MYSSESTFLRIQQSSVACRGHWNSGRMKGNEERRKKKKNLREEHPGHFVPPVPLTKKFASTMLVNESVTFFSPFFLNALNVMYAQ